MARTVHERSDVVPLIAEIFRDLGYEGTSLSRITERTRLGKGSLYHFFPGGKEEMAAAVLADVDAWFVKFVFEPLGRGEPDRAIADMWIAIDDYFRSGRRICLVGAFALDATRDRFAATIQSYFGRWIETLADALVRTGQDPVSARHDAEDAILAIQGALILGRALGDESLFTRTLEKLRAQVGASSPHPVQA